MPLGGVNGDPCAAEGGDDGVIADFFFIIMLAFDKALLDVVNGTRRG